jgi:hypothetical protein
MGEEGVHCHEHLARLSNSAARKYYNLYCLGDGFGLTGFIGSGAAACWTAIIMTFRMRPGPCA